MGLVEADAGLVTKISFPNADHACEALRSKVLASLLPIAITQLMKLRLWPLPLVQELSLSSLSPALVENLSGKTFLFDSSALTNGGATFVSVANPPVGGSVALEQSTFFSHDISSRSGSLVVRPWDSFSASQCSTAARENLTHLPSLK